MSTDTIRTEEKLCEQHSATVEAKATVTLASIVATVKHDCQQNAKAYLSETEVKHGGE